MEALGSINELSILHDHYMEETWLDVLTELSGRGDVHPLLGGYAAAIRLERGLLAEAELEQWISYRLSPGVPAEIAAAARRIHRQSARSRFPAYSAGFAAGVRHIQRRGKASGRAESGQSVAAG